MQNGNGSIAALFRLLVVTPRSISHTMRWRAPKYDDLPEVARDTTIEHTLSAAMALPALIAIEETHPDGRHKGKLNASRLITAAVVHDIGEGRIGEIPWEIKHDPRVEAELRAIEHEKVTDMFAKMPEAARDVLTSAYNAPHEDSLDGRFFDAAHLLTQMAFAVLRYEQGHKQFLECFKNVLPLLEVAAKEFISIEVCLAPYREMMAKEIERERRLAEVARLAETLSKQ